MRGGRASFYSGDGLFLVFLTRMRVSTAFKRIRMNLPPKLGPDGACTGTGDPGGRSPARWLLPGSTSPG